MPTFTGQVSASADDATQNDDGSGFTSVSVNLTVASNTAAASRADFGVRFQSVTIPNGAVVTAATLQTYVVSGSKNNNVLAHIYGEAADSAADYATTTSVVSRSVTTNSSAWSATGLALGYATTPDVSAAVQEVVSRTGWKSGNALNIIFKGDNSATSRTLNVKSFDAGGGLSATISVTWYLPFVPVVAQVATPAAPPLLPQRVTTGYVVTAPAATPVVLATTQAATQPVAPVVQQVIPAPFGQPNPTVSVTVQSTTAALQLVPQQVMVGPQVTAQQATVLWAQTITATTAPYAALQQRVFVAFTGPFATPLLLAGTVNPSERFGTTNPNQTTSSLPQGTTSPTQLFGTTSPTQKYGTVTPSETTGGDTPHE